MLAFSATGLRAILFTSQSLDPALEGRDIVLTGVVSALPQRTEAGVRFRLGVEDARLGGALAATLFYAWRPGVLGPLLAGLAAYLPLRLVLGW